MSYNSDNDLPWGQSAGICKKCTFPLDNHGLTYKEGYIECPISKGDAVLGEGRKEFNSAFWNDAMNDEPNTTNEPTEDTEHPGRVDTDGEYYFDH